MSREDKTRRILGALAGELELNAQERLKMYADNPDLSELHKAALQDSTEYRAARAIRDLMARSSCAPISRPSAEVRLNQDGTLDEVVTPDGDQLEQMNYNHWFLQINDVAVWLYSKGRITATHERRECFAGSAIPAIKEKP